VIVKVQPHYPGWFKPLADLAERKPNLALISLIGGFLTTGLAGFALGWFLKG
jgi:hypothetical protein